MTGKDRKSQFKKEGKVNIQSDSMFFIIKKKKSWFPRDHPPFLYKIDITESKNNKNLILVWKWAIILNLTQSRITWEDSLDGELLRWAWPMGRLRRSFPNCIKQDGKNVGSRILWLGPEKNTKEGLCTDKYVSKSSSLFRFTSDVT